MRNDKTVTKEDIKLVLKQLRKDSDDGWVLVDYVEKLFADMTGVRQEQLSDGKWVRGWREIGRRLGRSPGGLAVAQSLGQLAIEPTYFGRTPAYTEGQIEELLKTPRFQGRTKKLPEDS